jgi:serine/threonine protein kinase
MALGMLGKYERLDILGHGASGIVYLAQDTLLRRRVALKEITAQGEEMRRVLEEARVLDRLRHPNIVEVHSVDTIDGKVIIDMEYIPGSNLLEIMRKCDGPLPVQDAVDIATQICDGLAYAHDQRTIHRDIKPANILVSTDHRVKLADFGLAQVLGTNSYAGGAGTFAYMAPEDFEEGDRSDHQSDLWAAGVILYEMLTGRRPFTVLSARDPFAWSRAISKDDVAPPSQIIPTIPLQLDAICLKALKRLKTDRYQTADDMANDLSAVLTNIPTSSRISVSPRPEPQTESYSRVPPPELIGAKDIDALLAAAPSHWEELCESLTSRALATWLDSIGEPLLARVASELSHENGASAESRLRDFLYRGGLELDLVARAEARRGADLISDGHYAEAVESLQRSINLDPSHSAYFRMLADAATRAGDVDLARETLNKGLLRHPQDRRMKKDVAKIGGARPQLSTSYVNFGTLRHGESKVIEVTLRSIDNEPVRGRVASAPVWIRVVPLSFNARSRQTIKLTAQSGSLPREAQDYEEPVVIETGGGSLELPVALTLLPSRPPFSAIFYWYLPVLAFCILPAVVGQLATIVSHGRPFAPAGLIAGGTLFAAFLATNIVADTRLRERFVAGIGILLAPAGIVDIFSLSQSAPHGMMLAWPVVLKVSLIALVIPVVQAITLARARKTFEQWPIWCFAIAGASSFVSLALWHAGVARVQ